MRIFIKYKFEDMKAKLNITIDDSLLYDIKAYASRQKTSISALVEHYFLRVTKSTKRKNIIDLVEKLNPPKVNGDTDLKELFYREQAKKYGL